MDTFYVYSIKHRFQTLAAAFIARSKHDPKDWVGPRLPIKGVTQDGRAWDVMVGGIPQW